MLISSENAAKKRLAFDTSLKLVIVSYMFRLENIATGIVFDWEEILENWPLGGSTCRHIRKV
jgi:hypothetical protein